MIVALWIALTLGCLAIAWWLLLHPGDEPIKQRGGELPVTFDYREWK